jgi:hypothetical protein
MQRKAKKSKENGMSWKKLKDILPTRGEIYYMYIKNCQKLCTLCPLYRPDQGDIVGREYIIFDNLLCTYGKSLREARVGNKVSFAILSLGCSCMTTIVLVNKYRFEMIFMDYA